MRSITKYCTAQVTEFISEFVLVDVRLNPTKDSRASAERRYLEALAYRRAGKTLADIGAMLGVGKERARQLIRLGEIVECRRATGTNGLTKPKEVAAEQGRRKPKEKPSKKSAI